MEGKTVKSYFNVKTPDFNSLGKKLIQQYECSYDKSYLKKAVIAYAMANKILDIYFCGKEFLSRGEKDLALDAFKKGGKKLLEDVAHEALNKGDLDLALDAYEKSGVNFKDLGNKFLDDGLIHCAIEAFKRAKLFMTPKYVEKLYMQRKGFNEEDLIFI